MEFDESNNDHIRKLEKIQVNLFDSRTFSLKSEKKNLLNYKSPIVGECMSKRK